MVERFSKSKQKYMTSRIEQEIDITLISFLWDLIEDARKNVKLDYLQIIELTKELDVDGKSMVQGIHHSQEQPSYSKVYRIPIYEKLFEGKIYMIDEPDYAVMLFASEY